MNIGSLIRNARKDKKLNLEQLALIVGTDSGNLSRLERGLQGASQELLTKILEALGLSITEARMASGEGGFSKIGQSPADDDYALIKQYSVSGDCGDGYHNDHVEVSEGLVFKRSWLTRIGAKPENLAVIYAAGDSMEPYIFDGDVVLFDTTDLEPAHRKVYVMRRPDDSMSIKRLAQEMSGAWLITSDNPAYERERVDANSVHELPFIGRVIWRGGNMG